MIASIYALTSSFGASSVSWLYSTSHTSWGLVSTSFTFLNLFIPWAITCTVFGEREVILCIFTIVPTSWSSDSSRLASLASLTNTRPRSLFSFSSILFIASKNWFPEKVVSHYNVLLPVPDQEDHIRRWNPFFPVQSWGIKRISSSKIHNNFQVYLIGW